MRLALLSLAFALVSPFAFAQTDPNGETENPVTPKIEGVITTTNGAVSAFTPDEMIVLTTAGGESAMFVLSSTARYQDMAGNDINTSSIKEGTKVQVTAEENGDHMVATRVVAED